MKPPSQQLKTLLLALLGASTSNAFVMSMTKTGRTPVRMMAGSATVDSLKRVVLKDQATGHEATVHLHGGCVTSYKAPHEVLAIRKDAAFDGSKPIAGGLQICAPQFGAGDIQQHGFARNFPWELVSASSLSPEVTLALKPTDAIKKIWDKDFEFHLHVKLEKDHLVTRLTLKNTGTEDWSFTAALHSYYGVSHISKAKIVGPLDGTTYVDKTKDPWETASLSGPDLKIDKFLEGVLPGLKGPVSLSDSGRGTKTTVEHVKGWRDYVLWAPVGNESYGADTFVCVESGVVNAAETVKAGGEWVGEMKILATK